MSVTMVMRVEADIPTFNSYVEANAAVMDEISEDAKRQGCIHHRFAVGDGFVLVIDEWESAEAFQGFFEGNEAIAETMRGAGVQGEPQISIAESVEAAGTF